MPATTIALGIGHLPQDRAQNTVLEVHLHLDHPATPLSLGERWGSQSTGAGFTLQQATESRMEAHLRACGCEWLGRLALEERMSGRVLTPEEILQRRPEVVTPPPPPKAPAQRPADPAVLSQIRAAITAQDLDEIEGLRDVLNDEIVRQIASEWRPDLPWEIKDAYAALLLDQKADCVRPLFQDALASPTVESRAYAVCVLMKDFGRFEAMLVNGGLDEAKVDVEVAALSSPRP